MPLVISYQHHGIAKHVSLLLHLRVLAIYEIVHLLSSVQLFLSFRSLFLLNRNWMLDFFLFLSLELLFARQASMIVHPGHRAFPRAQTVGPRSHEDPGAGAEGS